MYYFLHFLVILPIVSSIERPEPMPFSITEAVLNKDDKAVLAPATAGDLPPASAPVPAA
jgi:ubiquinol-cytochrome c reductase cytochrome b subunit